MAYYAKLWDQFGGSEEEDIIREWPQPLKEQASFSCTMFLTVHVFVNTLNYNFE
jgi:hypothetical protein